MQIDTSRTVLIAFGCFLAAAAGVASCNTHPVEYRKAGGAVEQLETVSAGAGGKIDILWVLDNSGSMCEEQEDLRTNFRKFIEKLDETPANFNIGVTTTHFASTNFEFVARPGELQSTPHPPVGFGQSCRFTEDGDGNRDFQPLIDQINAAVECTKNPGQFEDLKNPSEARIRCALFDNCSGVSEDSLSAEELFPCAADKGSACKSRSEFQSVYRNVDKVLKATEYRKSDGSLELSRLRQDFACMSFVGTRGNSLEEGLKAAARAVSPVKTGGPADNPFESGAAKKDRLNNQEVQQKGENAPNHGLLRSDARTAVLFVTDENDCSNPGNAISNKISENSCSELNCYFPTSQDYEGEQLLNPVSKLYERFKKNLKDSKRKDSLGEEDVIIGSIHGNVDVYSDEIPDSCTDEQRTRLTEDLVVCNTDLGSAKSGDRYGDFLSNARSDNFETVPENTTEGLICEGGGLQGPLETIAEKFSPEGSNCITERVLPCSPGSDNPDCPSYEFSSDGAGQLCKQWGDTSGEENGYCESAIRLRMQPSGDRSLEDLNQTDRQNFKNQYCIEESIGVAGPSTCIVKRGLYEWANCPGDDSAVSLSWNDPPISNANRQLGAFKVEARFTEAIDARLDEGGSENGGGGNMSMSDAGNN